jgi:hypothetical protein
MKQPKLLIGFVVAFALTASTSVFAQVKIGTNPTTIGTNSNLEVEATNNRKVIVDKGTGTLKVENKPSAAATDSVVMRDAAGELHQMSLPRLRQTLEDSKLPLRGGSSFVPSQITFTHPAAGSGSITPNTFTPVPTASGPAQVSITNNSSATKVYFVTASYGYDGDWNNNVSFVHTLWALFLDGTDTGVRQYSEISPAYASSVANNGTQVSGVTSANGNLVGYVLIPPGTHILGLYYRGRAFNGIVGSSYSLGAIDTEPTIRMQFVQMN